MGLRVSIDWFYSLEREEAEDLIKRHGGRVTGSISKKTVFSYFFLVCTWIDMTISMGLTSSVCRIIFYVMKILGVGNPQKLKS